MIRTIKPQPRTSVSRPRLDLIPQRVDQRLGFDFLPARPNGHPLELLTSTVDVVQSLSQMVQSTEQRKAVEAQCRRDIHLSDDDVERARIARDRFAMECGLELARLETALRTQQDQNAREDARFREIVALITLTLEAFRETADPACLQQLPPLYAQLQPPRADNG